MSLVTIATLIGIGLYVAWLIGSLTIALIRGEVSQAEIEAACRGWGNVDSDVYDGEWGSRSGKVWCEWCHRYHQA